MDVQEKADAVAEAAVAIMEQTVEMAVTAAEAAEVEMVAVMAAVAAVAAVEVDVVVAAGVEPALHFLITKERDH